MDILPHHIRPCHCMFSTFLIQCRPQPCYRDNFLISNGAEVITRSAAFLRPSKHSVGFAGVSYPSFSSLRLSSSCWATLGVDQIAVLGVPLLLILIHAKLTLPRPSTINLALKPYQPLTEHRLNKTHTNLGQRPLPLQEPCTSKTSTIQQHPGAFDLSDPLNVWFTLSSSNVM